MDANRMTLLQNRVSSARSRVEQRKGQRDKLQQQRDALQASLTELRDRHDTITKAIILLDEAGNFSREQARAQVEQLTSMALQSVYGGGYQFRLVTRKIGQNTAIDIVVVSPYTDGDEIETTGTDSRGGGIVDLQALALRIAMLETYRPMIDGSVLLDEPCKHVSADFIQSAGQLLKMIAEFFGRQLIMVTHNEHLAGLADQTIRIELVNGASVVASA